MTRRFWVAAALVAALAGGTVATYAQGPGPRRPGPGHQMGRGARGADLGLRGIELTDAQREQVRTIRQSHREEFTKAGQALREAHRAFRDAVRSGDESAIRARSTAVANAMAEEAILAAKVRAEVHAILTPEQQQQLKQREADMQKRMQERQQRFQQRQQQRRPPQI